jgi:hypothetical protein
VLITDLQRANWPDEVSEHLAEELPALLVRDVSVQDWSNTWVADLRLRDDVADLETPATILAIIRHRGPASRRLQVTLAVDGRVVTTRTINVASGQSERQVIFEYTFSQASVAPGDASFLPVTVSLSPDRLTLDDQRSVVVPVVASLPAVFVDQVASDDEDPSLGRLGETRPLRQLLSPAPEDHDSDRHMIDVRHVTLDRLDQTLLASARLLVIAGIADPGDKVTLVREYVEQGGPLVIAAGADFDPVAWNRTAWLDGAGILPCRLSELPIGAATDDGIESLDPFFIDLENLASHPLLRLAGLSEEELRDLYRDPLFFKAIGIDAAGVETGGAHRGAGEPSEELVQPGNQSRRLAEASQSRWLNWMPPQRTTTERPDQFARDDDTATRATQPSRPEVCARFTDIRRTPFLVRQRIGLGQVLFASTGLLPHWNNLSQTNAVILWDHLLRGLMRSTLRNGNFRPRREIQLAVAPEDRMAKVQLQRPGLRSLPDYLEVGFIGQEQYGVTIRDAWDRGVYTISAFESPESTMAGGAGEALWQQTVAVGGESGESDLTSLSGECWNNISASTGLVLLRSGESLGAVAADMTGRNYWWWLSLAVLVVLLAELAVLAWSQF